jgi:guanylate kinase
MIKIRQSSTSKIVIISAPSGAGKSSIIKRVLTGQHKSKITCLISYTTRKPRSDESNGKNYFFVTKDIFKQMIADKIFVEWAIVHNNYYGTSKKLLDNMLRAKQDIILDIDVQGAIQIKQLYPNACMIFIMTPSLNSLYKRLILRQQDCIKIINERVKNAKKELQFINNYDYLVINSHNKLNNAVYAIESIIESLKYKITNRQLCFD